MSTALVPQDDINQRITDLKSRIENLDPPERRAKECAAMSELHDRINAGMYRDIIGEVYVSTHAAKRVDVKASNSRKKKDTKAAHEWITEWHGYKYSQQDRMLYEARNPAKHKAQRDRNGPKRVNVYSVKSLLNAIAVTYERSSQEEREEIKNFMEWLP